MAKKPAKKGSEFWEALLVATAKEILEDPSKETLARARAIAQLAKSASPFHDRAELERKMAELKRAQAAITAGAKRLKI